MQRRYLLTTAGLCAAFFGAGCSSSSGSKDVDAGAPIDGNPDGDTDASDGPAPIVAPADQWTWIDFPDSKCASGTATGIGVNIHPGAKNVLFYFEGGGACTAGTSCWGPDPGATNLDGFDATKFATAPQLNLAVLSRTAGGNPFVDYNYVFVPYCTGDLHSGTVDVDLSYMGTTTHTYFWGAKDLEMFLPRLVATFPDAERVLVDGGSAGGYGTVLSFDRIANAFATRVDIIDDSGPSITPKGANQNGALLGVWGFQPPTTCTAPCNSHAKVLAAARARQPDSRFAFLSYTADPVIPIDNGYTIAEYPAVLDDFVDSFAADPNAHAFRVTNAQRHVVQGELALAPQYLPWFTSMISDSPSWANVVYDHP